MRNLKQSLKDLNVESHEHNDFIRHLKGEVFAAQDEMLSEKDELFRAQLQVEMLSSQLKGVQQ